MSHSTSLAKFAFNIYGTLGEKTSTPGSSESFSSLSKFTYNCDREVVCLSELHHPVNSSMYHAIVGGKNYLKLLVLNQDQSGIVNDINLLDSGNPLHSLVRTPSLNKLHTIYTVKSSGDVVACGLQNGVITIYKVSSLGRSKLVHKLSDHKRCINSLDFVGGPDQPELLLSGSQDGTIKLWDLRQAARPAATLVLATHADPVRSCQHSPHSRARNKVAVLAAHDLGALCKYDLRGHHLMPERKWTYHTGPALSLHIHPTHEYVATGGRDKKVCVWNYADQSLAPSNIVHTYGPVMKVRWCQYPTEREQTDLGRDRERGRDRGSRNDPWAYDLACLYLNEDPTISVYNLRRKYIPQEIVSTVSHKPFQNFIWAANDAGVRKLWTITKLNVFVSYDLDGPGARQLPNVVRPIENLAPVAVDWTDHAALCTVAQSNAQFHADPVLEEQEAEEYFDVFDHTDASRPEWSRTEWPETSASSADSPMSKFLVPVAPNYLPSFGSLTSLPVARPSFHRAATFGPKSPSPAPAARQSESLSLRPQPARNPSQSTIDSSASVQPSLASPHHRISVYHQSPFLVPVSVPIPLNDHNIFKMLSDSYLMTIPELFTLVDVCHVNSRIAAAANRFRDCQIWRSLAISFDSANGSVESFEEVADNIHHDHDLELEIGHFVGSYNSNSTSTTNYGTQAANSLESKDKNLHLLMERNLSSHSLKELLHQNRSSANLSVSPSIRSNLRKNKETEPEKDDTAIDETADETIKENVIEEAEPTDENVNDNITQTDSVSSSPIKVRSPDVPSFDLDNSPREIAGGRLYPRFPRPSFGNSYKFSKFMASEDLDDENYNTNNAVSSSYSQSVVSTPVQLPGKSSYRSNSNLTRRSSVAPYSNRSSFNQSRPTPITGFNRADLVELEEKSEDQRSFDSRVQPSELTKAINTETKIGVPWNTSSLLTKALEYATVQGDIVMCATLILLFYPYYNKRMGGTMDKKSSLECLVLYIDILRRKQLFVNAVKVTKAAPKDLKEELNTLYNHDLALRFYCNWCEKLLVNEKSKENSAKEFGYWYCDECSRKQRNCIYCNEPCKGLNVVMSLRCGHRGHFGCFREWFIEDENTECPGGCDEIIFA